MNYKVASLLLYNMSPVEPSSNLKTVEHVTPLPSNEQVTSSATVELTSPFTAAEPVL